MLAGARRDRRRAQLEAAAGRPIRLADDEQLVGQLRDAGEQRNPEGAGAEERDPSDAPPLDPGGRLFGDLLVCLADPDELVLERLEVVDVEDAVEVVDLVLQRAREQLARP